ncbi:hypothetical protein [Novosphingobium sp. Leaf2]|uniref:hypothetical protein n=1 Tax=Novosphingobium sp. Leaf2 TaxID=1735670 RepID=UPI0006F5C71B|nr:hypothetical protein [Novosphingobium sp. Leaf2]KQM19657.1 hypothetical protein ASE49_05465 [Novosphingobium sp. Leaf2]
MQAEAETAHTDLLSALRESTGASHERLDVSFGRLDLSTREGLIGFLSAHFMGLNRLFETVCAFIEGALGLPCPDYPAMLRGDLRQLGIDADALPVITPPMPLDSARPGIAAGVGYVVCGSRLGLAMLRHNGYWGEDHGFRSAYMSDTQGQEAWKALVPLFKQGGHSPDDIAAARMAALAAFETFASAVAAVSEAKQNAHG